MAQLSDLIPYITNSLPMVSNLMATQQLNRTARVMCSESNCWKSEFSFNTISGQGDYPYVLPTDTERTRIDFVHVDNQKLNPTTWDLLMAQNYDPAEEGAPSVYTERTPGMLTLFPAPTSAGQVVTVRMSIMPMLMKDIFDDSLMAQHGQTLANGAMGYLMLMPGKVWSDAQGGMLYNQMFTQGLDRARTKSRDGSTTKVRVAAYGGL